MNDRSADHLIAFMLRNINPECIVMGYLKRANGDKCLLIELSLIRL